MKGYKVGTDNESAAAYIVAVFFCFKCLVTIANDSIMILYSYSIKTQYRAFSKALESVI